MPKIPIEEEVLHSQKPQDDPRVMGILGLKPGFLSLQGVLALEEGSWECPRVLAGGWIPRSAQMLRWGWTNSQDRSGTLQMLSMDRLEALLGALLGSPGEPKAGLETPLGGLLKVHREGLGKRLGVFPELGDRGPVDVALLAPGLLEILPAAGPVAAGPPLAVAVRFPAENETPGSRR